MSIDYLSLLSDPDDAPLFSEVYERYQETVKAAVLRNLDQRCDVDEAIDATWAEEARQFQKTKKFLIGPERDYRIWIVAFTAFIACRINEKLPGYQNEANEDEPTDFELLVMDALLELAQREAEELLEEK